MGAVSQREPNKEREYEAVDWQKKWHRVASTHTIQDLLTVDHAPETAAPLCFQAVLVEIGCILAGILMVMVLPVCLLEDQFNLEMKFPFCSALCLQDRCYGPLMLMTIPTAAAAVTLHWLLSKLFKHNY